MKRLIIVLALAICLIGSLSSCGALTHIEFSDKHGPCVKNAMSKADALAANLETRIGHGTFKGGNHMWCEFKDADGYWKLAKDTVGNKYFGKFGGWPIEAYKSGDKYDYYIDWYGYKGWPDEENEVMLQELGLMRN